MRHAFDKFGGNLGQTGCVSFMFDRKGVIVIENDGETDEEELTMDALEAGADDLDSGEEFFEITTAPENFSAVREALEGKYALASAEITMVPQTMTELTDETQIQMMSKMLDALEDNDDVQEVYHNFDAPDEEQ